MKEPGKRTEEEIDNLISVIKDIDFFKKRTDLNYSDLRDLAQTFTHQTNQKGEILCEYGDIADKFYVVLFGQVSVIVQNQLIKEWSWAMGIYNALQDWKENEFDKKVKKAMNTHF